jgi:DNA (cytosine-5)-methyltransferase 1
MSTLASKKAQKKLTAISLFTGAGGLDIGFANAGYEILWANDYDKKACETFRANHGDIIEHGSIDDFVPMLGKFKGADIVFGGPPCQGFSVAGKMDPDDERSKLVFSFMNVVEKVQPRAFVMENVKALGALDKWSLVREKLFNRGYELGYKYRNIFILNASEYGVPQKRERMFFIGLKEPGDINDFFGVENHFEKYKSKAPKVGEIIRKLGRAGSPTNPNTCKAKITIATNPILRRSPYAGMLFNGAGRPIDPNGYANTLPASMGGNKTPFVDEAHIFDDEPSWVEKYHKSLWEGGGKPLDFQEAPKNLRRITVNEAIRLQTFPDNYIFVGGNNAAYKQIGNSVPPKLAEVVANVMRDLLEPENPKLNTAVKQSVIGATR